MNTSVDLLRWRVVYGGYEATGHAYVYLVAKDRPMDGWIALYRPVGTCKHGPYAALPYGRQKTRRAAQKLAEQYERNSR